MTALGGVGIVVPAAVGSDLSTFAAPIAYADAAGEPGGTYAYGEFFALLDATQFVVTQAWVLAVTREYEQVAVMIVRGGSVDPGSEVLATTGTSAEISDPVRQLLLDQVGAR